MFQKILFLMALSLLISNNYGLKASESEYSLEEDGEQRAQKAAIKLIGKVAPNLELKTIQGKVIDLGSLYGKKPIYLKFWATWCIPCAQQMPKFEKIYKKFANKIEIFAVNTGLNDNEKSVKKYIKETKISMPIIIDNGSIAAAFHLQVTPMHVIIGRDGHILHIGHKDDEKLDKAIELAIAQGAKPRVQELPSLAQDLYKVGSKLNKLSVKNLNDKKIILGEQSNKPTALVFFAPWCESYLSESRPTMAKICKQRRSEIDSLLKKADINWYGISSNLWTNKEEVRDYKKAMGTKLELIYDEDGKLFRLFSVTQIPTVIVIDMTGQVIKRIGPDSQNFMKEIADSIK